LSKEALWFELQQVAASRSELQRVAARLGAPPAFQKRRYGLWHSQAPGSCRELQGVAGSCRELQGVAGSCRELQGVAGSCSGLLMAQPNSRVQLLKGLERKRAEGQDVIAPWACAREREKKDKAREKRRREREEQGVMAPWACAPRPPTPRPNPKP